MDSARLGTVPQLVFSRLPNRSTQYHRQPSRPLTKCHLFEDLILEVGAAVHCVWPASMFIAPWWKRAAELGVWHSGCQSVELREDGKNAARFLRCCDSHYFSCGIRHSHRMRVQAQDRSLRAAVVALLLVTKSPPPSFASGRPRGSGRTGPAVPFLAPGARRERVDAAIDLSGAPKTNRTSDLPLRRGLLYPLSYRGVGCYFT